MKGSVRNAIEQGAERLFPGYFAVVMATGIVSIGTIFLKSPCRLADTACTFQLGKAQGLPFFFPISYYSLDVAQLAWVVVFAGLLHRILRNLIVR